MSSYNLPSLPQRKIVNYFRDFEIEINEHNLMKPTAAFVQKFYVDILMVFTNRSYLKEIDSNSSNNIKNMIVFTRELTDFLTSIGLNNLTIKDIFMPSEKTFTQICSYIANFSMYRDSKKDLYDRGVEIVEETEKKKKVLFAKKMSIGKQIEELSQNKTHNTNKLNSTTQSLNLLNAQLKEIKQKQKAKMDVITSLKSKRMEMTDKKCELEMIEHDLSQDIKRLNLQIVSNPEELLSLVQEMRVLVDCESKNLANLSSNLLKKELLLKEKNKTTINIEKIHALTKEYNALIALEEQLEQKDFVLNSSVKNYENSYKNKKIRVDHLMRQLNQITKKSDALNLKTKKHTEEIDKKLKEIQEELNALTQSQANKESVKNSNKTQFQTIQFEKTKKEGDFNRMCSKVHDLLAEFSTKVEINKDI